MTVSEIRCKIYEAKMWPLKHGVVIDGNTIFAYKDLHKRHVSTITKIDGTPIFLDKMGDEEDVSISINIDWNDEKSVKTTFRFFPWNNFAGGGTIMVGGREIIVHAGDPATLVDKNTGETLLEVSDSGDRQ